MVMPLGRCAVRNPRNELRWTGFQSLIVTGGVLMTMASELAEAARIGYRTRGPAATRSPSAPLSYGGVGELRQAARRLGETLRVFRSAYAR
jgi:hypothetical protein